MANILIVEDSPELVEMLGVIFNLGGHRSMGARDIVSARALLESVPDIILMDVMLNHKISGRDFCVEIRQMYPNVPIILMSANPALLEDYGTCGATAVLEKPFDIKEIIDLMERYG